ncbi:MAG: hypothetical protein ACFFAE_13685 [Candidatus Hodarchaeota archaeon]
MNRKRKQLLVVSVALVALVLMNQSGITNATLQEPKRILSDTLVGEDPFIEALELIAAEGTALIAQYYQLNGEKKFPIDPSHSAFNKLDLMYVISSNQANWRDYWPRSIWEFRDGATILLQFSQGMEESLDDGAEIISGLNSWMGTTLDILYGAEVGGKTTLFYWGYLSKQNHSDFIEKEFYEVFSVGGHTNFITNEIITEAPVSVVGTGLVRNETGFFIPVAVAAFILENGISIDNDVHIMSIGSAFDFSGMIKPAPNSIISHVKFQLPYVANVYDLYPDTNNLYPELTGQFEWTLKVGSWIDNSYEDINVTYDMNVDELRTFPQITSDVSVDVDALHNNTDPMLNYSITMENTGNEKAYAVSFAWDLGEKRPEPINITIFDSETFMFNSTYSKFYNIVDGQFYDTFQGVGPKINVTGWFTLHDGTPIDPVNAPFIVDSTTYYMIDIWETYKSVIINKSFFTFTHSDNLGETTLENGNFALNATIPELNSGSSVEYWWSISDLPGKDDIFFVPGFNVVSDDPDNPTSVNVTFIDNTSAHGVGNNLVDYLVQEALNKGEDLRHPSLIGDPEFLPGVMFRYADESNREYFGWSNGLVVQLYDDEAILKTIVSLNSSIYRIDDMAKIDVSIENIGDANATNIFIQGFHAQLGPNWEPREIYNFTEVTPINDISNGSIITHTFYRNVSTFLGIHPVAIGISYTTEEDEGLTGSPLNQTKINGTVSNLILAIVLPKDDKAGEDEPSYPTPVVNVSVSWTDENDGGIENGDLIEIRTEVKNLGDEATTIKLYSYFPTRMASIDPSADYYDGYNYKVTDVSGNIIDPEAYDKGFALDNPDWPITIAAVEGLHLAPGATIIFYYKLTVKDKDSLIVPPVAVEYSSQYPMAGTSGMEGGEEGVESNPMTLKMSLNTRIDSSNLRLKIQAGESGGSSWTSYSDSSLLSAYAAVVTPEPSTTASASESEPPPSTSGGVNGFTTLTSFITENMRLMIVVLAIPILVLSVRELRRTRK